MSEPKLSHNAKFQLALTKISFSARTNVVSSHILWSFFRQDQVWYLVTFCGLFLLLLLIFILILTQPAHNHTQPTHTTNTQPTHNQHTTNIQPTHYQHQHTTNIQPKHNQHITNKHTTNTQPYTTNLALCYLFSFLQVPAEDPVRRSLSLVLSFRNLGVLLRKNVVAE